MRTHPVLAIGVAILLSASNARAADPTSQEPLIAVTIQGETLSEVLRRLCGPNGELSGYLCGYDSELPRRSGPHLTLAPVPASRAFGIVAAAYGACARIRGGEAAGDHHVVDFVECEVPERITSAPPVDDPKVVLGVAIVDVAEDPEVGNIRGAGITWAFEQGVGYKAGLRSGDIITSYNGEPVAGAAHLKELIGRSEPGDIVYVTAVRDIDRMIFNLQF